MPRIAPSIKHTLSSLTSVPDASCFKAPLRIHFPSAVVSAPGTQLSKQDSAPEPTFSVPASALDNLTFPNCDLSPTTSAATASFDSAGSTLSQEPDAIVPKFLVASLDLDPPFPSFPVLGPLLHGMQADLTLAIAEMDPDDEYIRLMPPEGSPPIVAYMGPAPPGISSPHRYMFLLWEQPEGVTGENIKEHLAFPEEGAGLMARIRWDQEDFERKVGLGKVVAGNFFVC